MDSGKKISFVAMGLCVLLQACAMGAHDRKYSLAIALDGVDKTPPCTVVLKSEVDRVIGSLQLKNSSAGPSWTVRDFQIELEQQLHRAVKQLACFPDDQTPLSDGSVKWLASYAYEATDPDQEIRRFEEYLNSRKLAKELIDRVPVVADERAGEAEGVVASEGACDRRSQWFGNADTPDKNTCSTKLRPLYKVLTYTNEKDLYGDRTDRHKDLIDRLLIRVKDARTDRSRNVRFLVLGYEIPWDEDGTLIRYGLRFYFVDTFDLEASAKDERATTTDYLGYELDYANEATPLPILAHSMKDGVFDGSRDQYKHKQEYERKIAAERTPAGELSTGRRLLYWTGYPFAVAIGVKNAVFEVAKMPFSTFAGLLSGRDNPFFYPAQNLRTAWNALEVEIGHEPYYYFLPGLMNLIGELPFVGQVFQFNAGPKHLDWDKAPEPGRVRDK
ncbi:MAG TPA: hypothetical protein VE222_13795, partial [Nitrospiraceae bacterium]|nr:hypothetical protein [Nitrospiraceae bacterium]